MSLRRVFCFGTQVHIDRGVFWLHYKLTFWTLCFISAFIGFRQCFGVPIECPHKTLYLDSYCWNHKTYVVDSALRNGRPPGDDIEDRVFIKGYQYYHLIVLIQAVGFLLPWLAWRVLEGRLMYQLTRGLNHPNLHPEVREKTQKQLFEFLHLHLRRNSFYLFFYLVCEVLCLVNAVVQLVLTNYFLNGAFSTSPRDVLDAVLSDCENRDDQFSLTFARSSLCTHRKQGSENPTVVQCFLPHNAFNELACVLIWYWTLGLAAATAALLLYHLFELMCSKLRLFALKRQARLLDRACLEKVLLDAGIGDWFLLVLLARNLDAVHLSDVFHALSEELGKSPLDNVLICYPTTQVVDRVQRTTATM